MLLIEKQQILRVKRKGRKYGNRCNLWKRSLDGEKAEEKHRDDDEVCRMLDDAKTEKMPASSGAIH
jgi:hypothetical protein